VGVDVAAKSRVDQEVAAGVTDERGAHREVAAIAESAAAVGERGAAVGDAGW